MKGPSQIMIDQPLFEQCLKGDHMAQTELYKRCYGFLMQICVRYYNNQDDAKEVLNQGFLKILKKMGTLDSIEKFYGWSKRIMVNTIIDEYRKNKHQKNIAQDADVEEDYLQINNVAYNQGDLDMNAEEIRMLIAELPVMSQKVFNLYIVDGYNHAEIADMLTISEVTSRWHLSNARKILKIKIKGMMNNQWAIAL